MSRESNVEALDNDSGYVLVRRKVQEEGREYANPLIFGGNLFIVSSSRLRSILLDGSIPSIGKRWRVDQPKEMNEVWSKEFTTSENSLKSCANYE